MDSVFIDNVIVVKTLEKIRNMDTSVVNVKHHWKELNPNVLNVLKIVDIVREQIVVRFVKNRSV